MELGKASEMDFVVPIIKWEHRIILREVAYEQEVSLVSTYLDRSEDDIRYFIDYCHPIGDANKKIAEEIGRVIEEYETGQLKPITKVNKKSSRSARHFEDEDTSELPTDIYPMR